MVLRRGVWVHWSVMLMCQFNAHSDLPLPINNLAVHRLSNF